MNSDIIIYESPEQCLKLNKGQKIEFICSQCKNVSVLRNFILNNILICGKCRRKNSLKSFNWTDRNKKTKQTKLERYGDENYVNPNKAKQTKLERYGDENYNNSEKNKQTCLEKYGVEYTWQSNEVKEKIKQTCLEKYGVENYNKLPKVRDKKREWITSYEFKKKNIQTCLKRYGISNGGGSKLAHSKMHRKYTYDNKTFDSSWEISLYIYLKDNGIDFEYQPNKSFNYEVNGKIHKYYPDFKINNKYIEIKGDHFFENNVLVNPFKRTIEEDNKYKEKHNCMMKNNIEIKKFSDLKHCIDYVNKHYGINYLSTLKNR